MPGCDSPPTGFLAAPHLGRPQQGEKRPSSRPTASKPSAPRCAASRSRPPPSGRRSAPTGASSRSAKRMRRSSAAATTRSANSSRACRSTSSSPSSARQAAASRRSSSPGCFLRCASRAGRRCGTWSRCGRASRRSRALAEAFGDSCRIAPARAAIDTWLEREAAAYRAGDAEKLARIVDRRLDAAPEKPDRLLIYVDQWEELYAMAPAPEDKERLEQHSADVEKFIALLVAAASGAGSRASVVMTVRADFYNPLIRNPLLAALLPKQQVNIPPMSRRRPAGGDRDAGQDGGTVVRAARARRPHSRRRRTGGRPAAAAPVRAEGDMGKAARATGSPPKPTRRSAASRARSRRRLRTPTSA